MRLLADIRDVFGDRRPPDHGRPARAGLHDLEDAPWADWYGKPLTARGLARLLEPYGVSPILRRVGGDRIRGYWAADLVDAWRRYVPLHTSVTPATSVPLSVTGTLRTLPGAVPNCSTPQLSMPPLSTVPWVSRASRAAREARNSRNAGSQCAIQSAKLQLPESASGR